MAQCIICLRDHSDTTVEHIIPRSLGNIHYVLPKGKLCSICNNRFAKYEQAVLNSPGWLDHRIALGLTKHTSVGHYTMPKEYELHRFLLKVMYEAMYHSRHKIFEEIDFTGVRLALSEGREVAVTVTPGKMIRDGQNIPGMWDAWRLNRNHLALQYLIHEDAIFWEFRFCDLTYVMSLSHVIFD